jgi:HD superfamily phosphohydrolase
MDVPIKFAGNEAAKSHLIFDPLYGFIHLTPVEREIIHSPFYQRLRWIKQLGFSSYVFPGAEHSRFGHSVGVMHNAHCIIKSCNKAVSDEDLMNIHCQSKDKEFHQLVRLGALMHDLGTFCFSHTTEQAYIRFGETKNTSGNKQLEDDHENLGSFIIKNTDYPGGITHILKKYQLDPQRVSDLVKGVDPSYLANQILHSEIDCDRMDYLLRDAHYTGLKYGAYDRDYLLYHFTTSKVGDEDILTIKHNALHCVEDFLMSRFAWYSQVIRSARGAKYDAIAETLCFYLLEKGLIYRYSDLLDMISNDPEKFWGFNDNYFISAVHEHYMKGTMDKDPGIKNMAKTLLFAKGARHVRCEALRQRLLSQDNLEEHKKYIKIAESKVAEIQSILDKKGTKADWMIADLPERQIIFVKSSKQIVESNKSNNVLLERDPVKISYENGQVKLLAEVENSIISKLHNSTNYIPNVFVSESAYNLLVLEGAIENVRSSEESG